MNEQRMPAFGRQRVRVLPEGIGKQPGNQVAADALRETFLWRHHRRAGNQPARLQRSATEIDLPPRPIRQNYTLTILRSKLDARASCLTASSTALDQHSSGRPAQSAASAKQRPPNSRLQPSRPRRRVPPSNSGAAGRGEAQGGAVAPKVVTEGDASLTEALLVKQTRRVTRRRDARQPGRLGRRGVHRRCARRGRRSEQHRRTTGAMPDRAALDAVTRWEFRLCKPQRQPMPVTMRRRIEFKLHQQRVA